jgi:hypothetical protein
MKKIIIAVVVGILAGAALAASVQDITVAATGSGYQTGTWVNTLTPKRDVLVKSAFVQFATAVTNETVTAKVSKSGVTYTVDTGGPITGLVTSVDFNMPVMCAYGQTVTVARTSASTGVVANVMLVVE